MSLKLEELVKEVVKRNEEWAVKMSGRYMLKSVMFQRKLKHARCQSPALKIDLIVNSIGYIRNAFLYYTRKDIEEQLGLQHCKRRANYCKAVLKLKSQILTELVS